MEQTTFNPTKKNLINLDSLILDIKTKKNVLIGRKTSLENSLTQLKEKYKFVHFNGKEFKKVKSLRENIKQHLSGIEIQIQNLNTELNYKNKLRLEVEFYVKNHKTLEHNPDLAKIINKLSSLKVKYSDFTKDRTRIASLRVMASEFITDIEIIMKNI